MDRNRNKDVRRLYDYRWRQARVSFLTRNPLCIKCEEDNKIVPATVVDHRIPHKGDIDLFWDSDNWSALCKRCHDVKTAKEDGAFGREVK